MLLARFSIKIILTFIKLIYVDWVQRQVLKAVKYGYPILSENINFNDT